MTKLTNEELEELVAETADRLADLSLALAADSPFLAKGALALALGRLVGVYSDVGPTLKELVIVIEEEAKGAAAESERHRQESTN